LAGHGWQAPWLRRKRRRFQRERQTQADFGAAAWPVAMRFHAALMHFDDRLDERQSDAEPGIGPFRRAIDPCKHLKDAVEHIGRNADSAIADGYQDVARVAACGKPNISAARRVLGGIVEQIRQDLREAVRICI
jgi:hypothetical protein